MAKYHLTEDGPKKCSAQQDNCPITKNTKEEHFANLQEAQAAYETRQAAKFSSSPMKRPFNFNKTIDFDEDTPQFNEEEYVEKSYDFINELNDDEKLAVKNYVQDRYGDINSYLYGTPEEFAELDNIDEEIKALDAALAKNTIKPPKTVWRSFGGSNLNKIFHEQGYEIGEIVEFKGYTSTAETASGLTGVSNSLTWYSQEVDADEWETEDNSYRIKLPEEYAKNGTKGRSAVLCIRPKNAAPVSMLRGRPTEQEWLIPRGAKFKVSEIYEDRTLEGKNMREGTYAHVYVLDEI